MGMRVFMPFPVRLPAAGIRIRGLIFLAAVASIIALPAAAQGLRPDRPTPGIQASPDATGAIATININGRVNEHGAFFQSLGVNGRSCATCHVAGQAMSISAQDVRRRFQLTRGQIRFLRRLTALTALRPDAVTPLTTACCSSTALFACSCRCR